MVIEGTTANLFAIRDIPMGQEITFDYSTVMAEDGWAMPCLCGRPSCRGVIRTGQHLPPELKDKYRRLGVLAPYIR